MVIAQITREVDDTADLVARRVPSTGRPRPTGAVWLLDKDCIAELHSGNSGRTRSRHVSKTTKINWTDNPAAGDRGQLPDDPVSLAAHRLGRPPYAPESRQRLGPARNPGGATVCRSRLQRST